MAVISSPYSSSGEQTGSTVSFNHITSAGDDRLLLVTVINVDSSAIGVANANYDGNALTFYGSIFNDALTYGTDTMLTEVWYLKSPPVGTLSLTVNKNSSGGNWVVHAWALTNVDQTTPLGTLFTNLNSGTSQSVDVTGTSSNGLVIDALALNVAITPTVGANQATKFNEAVGNGRAEGSEEASNGGTVTMSWSTLSNTDWAIAAVEVKPVIISEAKTSTLSMMGVG
jgi:hypothetical protein